MVNNIDTSSETPLKTDEEEGVNAIPLQCNQQQSKKLGFDGQKRRKRAQNSFGPKVSSKPLRRKHDRWGSKAILCKPGCALYPSKPAKKKAGQRMFPGALLPKAKRSPLGDNLHNAGHPKYKWCSGQTLHIWIIKDELKEI